MTRLDLAARRMVSLFKVQDFLELVNAGHRGVSLIELSAVQQKADKMIVEAMGRSSGRLPPL